MSVEIVEKVTQITSFTVKGFTPCCKAWEAELGSRITAVSDGTGFVPADVYLNRKLLQKIVSSPLKLPWMYCPYCGHQFQVQSASETEQKVVLEPSRMEIG